MVSVQYVWILWAASFLIPWLLLYAFYPSHRRIMLQASFATMPFGLTEPLFVPEYWSPPSLFNLALRTGFDIESLVFCFALGGIAVILYAALTQQSLHPVPHELRTGPAHKYHRLALITPAVVFPPLSLLPWNPIYPAVVAMLAAAFANMLCRPDLVRKTCVGGLLFLALYAVWAGGLELFVPGYIAAIWNLEGLSGVLFLRVPLEEFLFGFAFGMYWSGVYEHFTWRRPTKQPLPDVAERRSAAQRR
jgi:hypothetical protein